MNRIIRCITSDGGIMASAINSTDIVYTAQRVHKTSPVATAALGRLITASSMMGAMLKKKDASITLRVNGGGPIGAVIAVADSNGNCRGYVENASVEVENYPNGKLNVAAAVGKNGILNVMKDLGTGEPYVGQIELISGEIAEDITNYYATSEQTPTVCALGVLVDKQDKQVLLSGGLLIQLLPGASEESIEKLEKNISSLEPVTTMLAKGMDIEEICKKALEGFEVEVLDEFNVAYTCNCSEEKVKNAIKSLSNEEILSLGNEDGVIEAKCHFCDKVYKLTESQLNELVKEKIKKF